MAIWGAVIGGVVAAGSAYVARKDAKKANQQKEEHYDERVAYERERLAQRRNSMGARMAPYLMDQMLRVYADQTKGNGGFNLPVDEIIKNMRLDERKQGGGQFGGGGSSYTPYEGTEWDLARMDRQRRNAWQRDMPTDLGLGSDQIEGPSMNVGIPGLASAGTTEMDMFSQQNANPVGLYRENMENLDQARGGLMNDLTVRRDRGENKGIDIDMPDMPEWMKFGKGKKPKSENSEFFSILSKLMKTNPDQIPALFQYMGRNGGS